jgi:NADH:ubiquinone oxidoreductase subunit B-like Fe-S oxidoreductase
VTGENAGAAGGITNVFHQIGGCAKAELTLLRNREFVTPIDIYLPGLLLFRNSEVAEGVNLAWARQ